MGRVVMKELDELEPGCVSTIAGGYVTSIRIYAAAIFSIGRQLSPWKAREQRRRHRFYSSGRVEDQGTMQAVRPETARTRRVCAPSSSASHPLTVGLASGMVTHVMRTSPHSLK